MTEEITQKVLLTKVELLRNNHIDNMEEPENTIDYFCTPEPTIMDIWLFKQKRKPIDLAAFVNNLENLRKAKEEFLEELQKTPADPAIQCHIDKLLEKADTHIKKLEESGVPFKEGSRGEFARRLSLRTQARISHLKLNGLGGDQRRDKSPTNNTIIHKSEVEGITLAMSIDRLKYPATSSQLELISDILIEAKNFEGEVSKPELEKFISTKIDGFVPALASEEDLAVPWRFEIHSAAAKV
jgi:hypothetical protein